MSMKTCVKCATDKPLADFLSPGAVVCSPCKKRAAAVRHKAWYEKNRARALERCRVWAANNAERVLEIQKIWRNRDPERAREIGRRWRAANPDRVKENNRAWHERNPGRRNETDRARRAARTRTITERLQEVMATTVRRQLMGAKRGSRTFDLLGYSVHELRAHLEARFTDGMTWENYGIGGWEIDHIKPKRVFSFESASEPAFRECWALSNLQPLWAKDNRSKAGKWTEVRA